MTKSSHGSTIMKHHTTIFVGTAGWNYDDWVGPFYPEHLPHGFSRLRFYATFFDCVEVNSTFYRHFHPMTAEKWLLETSGNPDFEFLIKLHKNFTHGTREEAEARREQLPTDTRTLKEFLKPFVEQSKLGGILVQFSEYFRSTDASRAHLSSLAETFSTYPLFIELRHISWYTDDGKKFLEDRHVHLVAVDQPVLKGMVKFLPEALGGKGYVRLHGRNYEKWFESRKALGQGVTLADSQRNDRYNYLYTRAELNELEEKISAVKERCDKLYVVANNHPLGKAAANALELVKRLRGQEKVPIPSTILQFFPELESIAQKVPVDTVAPAPTPSPAPKRPHQCTDGGPTLFDRDKP